MDWSEVGGDVMPFNDRGNFKNVLGSIEYFHYHTRMVVEVVDGSRSIEPLVCRKEQQANLEGLGRHTGTVLNVDLVGQLLLIVPPRNILVFYSPDIYFLSRLLVMGGSMLIGTCALCWRDK